jgi:hypothetical protein
LNQNNILLILQNAITNGLNEIITIAGKFDRRGRYWSWEAKYHEFVRKLRQLPNVNIHPITEKNWHAKVSIRINKGKPIAAIIGSSNLTTNAYGLFNRFNHECDVVLWENKRRYNNIMLSSVNSWNEFDYIYLRRIRREILYKGEKVIKEEDRLKDTYMKIKEIIDKSGAEIKK